MQENWGLIINLSLLAAVIYVILHLLRKKDSSKKDKNKPATVAKAKDDIVSVRKIELSDKKIIKASVEKKTPKFTPKPPTIIMFLKVKQHGSLEGYVLLQSLLSAGLRFGSGNIFHKHQLEGGRGAVLCSLAAATPDGTFNINNIKNFKAQGLCIFMHASKNSVVDKERFDIMLQIAMKLAQELNCELLDEKQLPVNKAKILHFRQRLGLEIDKKLVV